MPALFFNNIWMLAGLVALAIPVLIHLLLRRKKKRVRFSTLQFFQFREEQASQRRKLRNWLLLALRLLICALLVLAFARPFLADSSGIPGRLPRRVVILLDRSLSMRARVGAGTRWDRALERVGAILSGLSPKDRVAVVGCAARAELLAEWASPLVIREKLQKLQPSWETTRLADGLRLAGQLLAAPSSGASRQLIAVSDFQKSGAEGLASTPIAREIELKLENVGDFAAPNLAITDLQMGTEEGGAPHLIVTSYSDESVRSAVEVSLDGKLVETDPFALSPGGVTNLEFRLPTPRPGWHEVRAKIQAPDSLAADDVAFLAFNTPEPVRVWIAETRTEQRSFEQESFFIRTALDPLAGGTNGAPSRFVCEWMPPEKLAGRLDHSSPTGSCDLVILPGLRELPGGLASGLSRFVRAGGGLLLFVGEGVSANLYNSQLSEWLPARLDQVERNPDPEFGWHLGEWQTNSAVFASFAAPESGDPSLARFFTRFEAMPAADGSVLGRFADQKPFLVARSFGRGRVLLANTSADTSWTDWPKHKTYVPWLHGAGLYLTSTGERRGPPGPFNYLVQGETDLELGPTAAKASLRLVKPIGPELALQADATGRVQHVSLDTPGVYHLRTAQGREVRRWAVRVPPAESDLQAIPTPQFEQMLTRTAEKPETSLLAGLTGPSRNQKEMWRVLLMAVLGLLFLELLIANRTLA